MQIYLLLTSVLAIPSIMIIIEGVVSRIGAVLIDHSALCLWSYVFIARGKNVKEARELLTRPKPGLARAQISRFLRSKSI